MFVGVFSKFSGKTGTMKKSPKHPFKGVNRLVPELTPYGIFANSTRMLVNARKIRCLPSQQHPRDTFYGHQAYKQLVYSSHIQRKKHK